MTTSRHPPTSRIKTAVMRTGETALRKMRKATRTQILTGAASMPAPGETVGSFKILKEISTGGMGSIFKARGRDGRYAAIKLIKPEHVENQMLVKRFERELKIVSMLQHENIAKLLEWGMDGDRQFFAMEYVEGRNLREVIEDDKPAVERTVSYVSQVCSALAYAHSKMIVHRDIKPENILVDQHGKIKVVDFGIARIADDSSSSMTLTSIAMGSPMYMSPEQKSDFKHTDHRADIYSLGVVFYEMLSGEFPGGLLRIDLVPEGLRSIIQKCIAFLPEDRYDSVPALQKDLAEYQAGGQIQQDQLALQEIGGNARLRKALIDALYPREQPKTEGLDLAYFYLPACGVGGNYFDFIEIDASHIGILVGNVFEKPDVKSAILLAMLRSAFRMASAGEPNPAKVLKAVNNFISKENFDRFAVFSYIVCNTVKKTVSVSTAGYRPVGILKASAAKFDYLHSEGLGLGIMADTDFGISSCRLETGDLIVMCSGGVLETRNLRGQKFRVEDMEKVVLDNRARTSAEIVDRIRKSLVSFSAGVAQQDDITVLAVKVK